MKFSLFFIAEYSNMVTASALLVTLFFGGWDIPFTLWDNQAPWSIAKTMLTGLFFAVKVLFFLFFYMWIRWTLPRFRYDQLMSLGWRVLLPVALVYIILIAGTLLVLDLLGIRPGATHGVILGVVNLVLTGVLFVVLDSGRIISPAYGRIQADRLRRLRAMRSRSPLAAPGAD
jgi:NADH-quinone oxidoreductase subunit H